MKKRWVLISMFTAVLLLTMVPAGEARGVEMATEARSVADEVASAGAVFPAAIAGELDSDFKLSSMGPLSTPNYPAIDPAVAYNSTNNRYLVVWQGVEDVVGENEIWVHAVDAASGALLGGDFKISDVGPDDDPAYDALDPDVAYNSVENEYLVVWSADQVTDNEFEIWGRRVDAYTMGLLGPAFQISVMGPNGSTIYDGQHPSVAYNSTDNQYLVVWQGSDDTPPLVAGEFEIWARRLDADGNWLDADQRRLSDMGGLGDAFYDALYPDVAYNSTRNQYMVVWCGDDSRLYAVDEEYEIWGQQLNASAGHMGAGDFRISTMGPTNDPDADAIRPQIAYNSIDDEYLVVWYGEDAAPEVYDIYAQRLAYNGIQVGADDFRLSHSGNGPNLNYDAYHPAVAHDPRNNEYLVVWHDDELGTDEFEVWGQRVNAATGDQIDDDIRLSDMGPDGNTAFDAHTPAVAYSSAANNQYLVVWYGDDSTDGDFEIWGQRFVGAYRTFLPLVLRND